MLYARTGVGNALHACRYRDDFLDGARQPFPVVGPVHHVAEILAVERGVLQPLAKVLLTYVCMGAEYSHWDGSRDR